MSEFPNPCPYGGILYEGVQFGHQRCPNCGRNVIVREGANPRWPDHGKNRSILDELVPLQEDAGLYDEP